jgi:polysaccharide export outer membrane protein
MNYLENIDDTLILGNTAALEARIKKNDMLSIRVYSMSIDPATDLPYNLPETGGQTNTSGFLVDRNGNIEYPRVGTLKAEGLSKEELAEVIRQRLSDQLKQPSVVVRFQNYRITVLGEVRSPGTYTVASETLTILEALGMAGDVTEFGRRGKVKILREGADGQRSIASLDLTSSEMFTSPYFRLQQNDVIFVDQTERRLRQQEQQQIVQQIGIATGLITTIALILNFIK